MVKPTMPCSPGVLPVPMEAMLTAVVEGKPAVSEEPLSSKPARKGAFSRFARTSSQPSPSTRSRQALATGSMPSAFGKPPTPSAASREGVRSLSAERP